MFESVRELMDIPRIRDTRIEAEWHDQAPDIFTEKSDILNNQQLVLSVRELLVTYPHEALQQILEIAGDSPTTETITELRFMRKVLLVGRDTLKLCTVRESTISQHQQLSALSHQLGSVVDGIEQRHETDIAAAVHLSTDLSRRLEDISENIEPVPASLEKIKKRAQRSLLSEELMREVTLNAPNVDERDYHRARRLFRSVVHLGIISQLVAPAEQKQQFVMHGIELSAYYGEIHDAMLAQSNVRSQ